MLWSLLGGERRPASELALIANISPQTASNHLRLLLDAGFLKAESVGRNKFFRLAAPAVGVALESLAAAAGGKPNGITQQTAPELVFARACYDHLAGELGVEVLNRLRAKNYIREHGKDYQLSKNGEEFFRELSFDQLGTKRRRLAYPCLDWSQRVPHLGGALGAVLLNWLFRSKAIARQRGTRAVRVTDAGRKLLSQTFGIKLNRLGAAILE